MSTITEIGRKNDALKESQQANDEVKEHDHRPWIDRTPSSKHNTSSIQSALRIDSRKNIDFNIASKDVHILCGAHVYCFQHGSTNNNTASRKTDVFLASAIYS